MRPLFAMIALPLLGAASPSTDPSSPAGQEVTARPERCQLLTATGEQGKPLFRKLGELPPAETFAAVWRTDERGCPHPLKYDDR